MSIDRRLLEILACPVSKAPLQMLPQEKLATLNKLITAGEIADVDHRPLEEPLRAALITEDNKVIYPIIDDHPILLSDRGIGTQQIKDWPA